MRTPRPLRALALTLPCAVLLAGPLAFAAEEGAAATELASAAARRTTDVAVEALAESASGGLGAVTRAEQGGAATFVRAARGAVLAPATGDDATTSARAFVERHGRAFGVTGGDELAVVRSRRDVLGMSHVRLQQRVRGVPVTGAEIAVHLRDGAVVAASARTSSRVGDLDTIPTVTAAEARIVASRALARRSGTTRGQGGEGLVYSTPRLEILDRGLLGGRPLAPRLAWFVEVQGFDLRERLWIDARRGGVLLRFSQLPDARKRLVYDAGQTGTLRRALAWREGTRYLDVAEADLAYAYSGDTYDFFWNTFGRDSYDGLGASLISSVRYCPSTECPFVNAFWNGTQMVYGTGFTTQDISAHELTHAVIDKTAGLFYYMQSGALSESFADVFGETVDLLATDDGDDTPGVRWLVGEDVALDLNNDGLPDLTGPLRNMMEPGAIVPVAGWRGPQPAALSDTAFSCDNPGPDGGGVHTNSGVPNHAYALAVDGGTFGGQTVVGIGLDKASRVWYRALSEYLGPAANFRDAYDALQQSCADLVGTAGITAGDCAEVSAALDAVELGSPWPCYPQATEAPPLCPAGQGPADVFFDDLENTASGRWTTASLLTGAPNAWTGGVGTPGVYFDVFATSGRFHFWGLDLWARSDSAVTMKTPVIVPADGRLSFQHSFGFDAAIIPPPDPLTVYYDGGVIEYCLRPSGQTCLAADWLDAGGLITAGQAYNGTLESSTNTLNGRQAFGGESWGMTATQLDLSALAGQPIRFRFRLATDSVFEDYGWFIDDVRVYGCSPGGSLSLTPTVSVGEAAGKATLTVTRSDGLAGGVTVDYATAGIGQAEVGLDYTATGGTLSFGSFETTKSLSVPILKDTLDEPAEAFQVTLANPAGPGATLGPTPTGEVTIADDDVAGAIQFALVAQNVSESASLATIVVTRSGGLASGASVDYAASEGVGVAPLGGPSLGPGQAGQDFTPVSGSLTFAAGQTRLTFVVPLTPDTLDESNETVALTLTNPGGGATLGARSALTLTIVDNDTAGLVQFGAAQYTVNESATTATLTVTRVNGAASGVTVAYSVTGGSADAGDYNTGVFPGVLSFAAGQTSRTISVPLTADMVGEGNETVVVTLSSPTGGATLGTRTSTTLTIVDNDPYVQLTAPAYSLTEGNKATITVRRFGTTAAGLTVDYRTVEIGGGATPDDYTAVSGTVTFAAGVSTATFKVPTTADTVDEDSESLSVEISNASLGGVPQPVVTPASATLIILDNDAGGVLQFGALNYSANESATTGKVTVTRSGGVASGVTVTCTVTGGTADGGDYDGSPFPVVVSFAAGELSRAVSIPLLPDTFDEPNETILFALSSPTGGATLGTRLATTLTIVDND